LKLQPFHGYQRLGLDSGKVTPHQTDEAGLKFPTQNCRDPGGAQVLLVQGGVETVATQVRRRIQHPDARDRLDSQARGGVHRQVKRNQLGLLDFKLGKCADRGIDRGYVMTFRTQPGRWRSYPEGLASQFISRDKDNPHLSPV
jgi:hypothetical protein